MNIKSKFYCKVKVKVMSDSLQPHGLYSLWNSPGQNTVVASPSLLQGICPTQGSNPGLPHRRNSLSGESRGEKRDETKQRRGSNRLPAEVLSHMTPKWGGSHLVLWFIYSYIIGYAGSLLMCTDSSLLNAGILWLQ